MSREEEIAILKSEPCQCVRCEVCNGTGEVRYEPENQFNDETESCDYCDKGISEVCGRCQAMEDMIYS